MRKQKIKVMKHQAELPEEEIKRYMNFDEVLMKHQAIVREGWKVNAWKWGVPLLTASLLLLVYVWRNENKIEPVSKTQHQEEKINPIEKPVEQPISDSINGRVSPSTAEVQKNEKLKQDIQPDQQPNKKEIAPEVVVPAYTPAEPLQGYDHLYAYFNSNLIYPPAALKDSLQAVLNVTVTINEDGNVDQIAIGNSVSALFDEEAKRLMQTMPGWKPARLNGKPVKSRVSIPLVFQYKRMKHP